jgi:hypothetical protein
VRRRPPARRAAAALGAGFALLVGAGSGCTDDDGGGGGGGRDRSGCPVSPAEVGDALGYEVVVDEDTASETSCRFVPADGVEGHPGSSVVVAERELASGPDDEEGFDAVQAGVASEVGPVEAIDGDDVDGADRGWVATLGRVVQVGAADGDRLVQVTVADGELDAAEARAVALQLAEAAL